MGKIYAFLRDTFGEIVAADPRSRHDADYFLSRRFTLDIEESEWLYSSVCEVHEFLDGVERAATTQRRVKDLIGWHRVVSGRMIAHLTALQPSLRDPRRPESRSGVP